MHVAALLAAATLATAAAVRNDPYVGNFRSFGAQGCHDENLGVWTVTQSGLADICNNFNGYIVKSLENTNIVQGYTMYLFTDDHCEQGRTVAPKKGCNDAEKEWKRWRIERDT